MKLVFLVAQLLLCSAHTENEITTHEFTNAGNTENMQKVFARSEQAHKESMATIMLSMTSGKAMQVLEENHLTTPALTQATALAFGKNANLRKQPKGYSGLDGARNLLNDMIFESMSKYDAEIAKCTDYYSKQCAAMEACRGQISASNYIAANSRALILDSQSTINKCEVDIPTRKQDLKQHLLKCKNELNRLNTRVKIVMGDIAVMTTILEMTDCEKKFVQMEKLALLHCEGSCSNHGEASNNKSFVTFKDEALRHKVSQLQSSVSHELMEGSFADLFEGIESLESMGVQQIPKKTKFNNPPVPKTKVPGKPGPYPTQWISKCGCHIGKSPMCYKLQGRFLLIQAGIQDERDNLLEQIAELERSCEETKNTIETDIANDQDALSNAQTKLAAATEKEATAGETARQTAAENEQLNNDLVKQMKTCSGNYINFETEICALKKIRGELYKMKGGGHSAFFQDCEVSKWDPEECTKVCAGGEQKLTRSVLTHPKDGTKCLPLGAMKSCNNQPCPVNCRLAAWSGWSKCSSDCGGGVTQRLREVKMAMKYGGKPCGATSQTGACNAQACEADCDLSKWTKWSACSKDCDGGTKKRQKFIKNVALGDGECPGAWSKKRLEYAACNAKRCKISPGQKALTCNKTVDLILLLDGSASMGKKGFASEITAARALIDAYSEPGAKTNMAVILFSGPRTWTGVAKCTGKSGKKVDTEKVCGIKMVSHFTSDLKKVKQLVTGLDFPKGGALTSLALLTAKAELSLGRKNARANVVVFTAGRPLSFRKTSMAATQLRSAARLVWVPVTQNAPLGYIKKWATRRWQENVVSVKSFEDLAKPDVITHIVANICPKTNPKVKFGRK